MAWRTLLIQHEGKFSLGNNQLVCDAGNGKHIVAVEELAVVIVESHAAVVTSALLAKLCEAGVAVVVCDARHMPSGLLLPFHTHTRQAGVAAEQIAWSKPFRKRAWQTVVQRKIRNQAACLERLEMEGASALRAMADQVGSGDAANCEGRAAQFYWKQLFGGGFKRTGHRTPDPDRVNSALNYGYAVARAAIARAIAAHGLLPCFGIHHDNQLNAFNLADDLIEPFRPIVDLGVALLAGKWESADAQLGKDDRTALAGIGGWNVRIEQEHQSLIHAADDVVESLIRAGHEKDAQLLRLPEFATQEDVSESS